MIDPGASVLTGTVSVDGEVAAEDAPLFFLDGHTLNPLEVSENGTAVLEGTTVAGGRGRRPPEPGLRHAGVQDGMTIGVAKITINTSA